MQNKKILIGYLIGENNSGIDKYILAIVNFFNKKNFEVGVLSSNSNIDVNYFENKYKIKIYIIHNLTHPILQFKEIRNIIRQNNYKITYYNISDCSNIMGILASFFCKIKFRIVHSHSSSMNGKTLKKKILYIFHLIFKQFIEYLCNIYLACSKEAAEWMYNKRIFANKEIVYIFNYIDVKKFLYNAQCREKVRAKYLWNDKIILGHIGNFTETKNHNFVIEIFKQFIQINPNSILILIGDGNLRSKIEKKVTENGLKDKVVFFGIRNDVNLLLQGMDIFLLPSISEGLPISVIEAQVAGVDCFVSDTISKESCISSSCHFLSLSKDAQYWAQYIKNNIQYRKNYDEKNFYKYDKSQLDIKLSMILKNNKIINS